MKKLILLIVLFLCLPVRADTTSWLWADDDALGVRVGVKDDSPIEVGLSALWLPDREEPEIWGIYALYHLPEIVNVPNPIVVDFLPEIITGTPYLGGKLDIDFDDEVTDISPVAGIVLMDVLFIEYQFEAIDRESKQESKVLFGLRIKF